MNKKIEKLLLLTLIFVLLIGGSTIFNTNILSSIALQACESITSCDEEAAALGEEKKKLEEQLKDLQSQQDDLNAEMALLQQRVKVTEEELATIEHSIDVLLVEMARLETEIAQKEEDVSTLLRQQQKETNSNLYLTMLLSASSLSEFITKVNAVDTINNSKQKYIVSLQEDKNKLAEAHVQLNEKKIQVEENKAEYSRLLGAVDATLKKLREQAANTVDKIGDIEMSEDEINRQRRIVEGANRGGSGGAVGVPSADGWYLPAATGWLTCEIHCYADHIGTDFGMPIGTSVYAIADGVVVHTKYSTARTGYGTMITIAHNINGVPHISIYGHLSGINVQEGQVVSGGQLIGQSGNTGASTGPHLHVEIIHSTNVFVDKSFRRTHVVDARDVLPKPSPDWRW